MDNVEKISENYLDLDKILSSKGIHIPHFAVALLKKLLHVDEINKGIYDNRDKEGADFAQAVLDYIDIRVDMRNASGIPASGNPIIVANHPLGGPDGMALIAAVGKIRRDILFPVNDFLTHIPNLRSLFVPVDKVHGNRSTAAGIDQAFAGDNVLLFFPAGLCSRRIDRRIVDLQWKTTFVKKALQYHRDIIPVHIDARNRRRFYTLANLRKRLGVKFNFEMALLPSEMFAQRGKTMTITVGDTIPWQRLDNGDTPRQWADKLHDYIYTL